jgi:hypothetical protein
MSLPHTNSGFGGITHGFGMLPSIGSLTGSITGMLSSIGSLRSLPAGIELPPEQKEAEAEIRTAVATASTIQTLQPISFSAAAKPVAAPPALMARLIQKRKQQAGKAGKAGARPAAAALTTKKKVTKPSKVKSAAARSSPSSAAAAAAAAGEKKAQVGPWSADEITELKRLVEEHGDSDWQQKADAMGTGRTAKAVHTRWLRESGRIIDMPRGQQSTLGEVTSIEADRQRTIMETNGHLLPVLTGSLGAAFGWNNAPKDT